MLCARTVVFSGRHHAHLVTSVRRSSIGGGRHMERLHTWGVCFRPQCRFLLDTCGQVTSMPQ